MIARLSANIAKSATQTLHSLLTNEHGVLAMMSLLKSPTRTIFTECKLDILLSVNLKNSGAKFSIQKTPTVNKSLIRLYKLLFQRPRMLIWFLLLSEPLLTPVCQIISSNCSKESFFTAQISLITNPFRICSS